MKLLNALALFRTDMYLECKDVPFNEVCTLFFPFFSTGVLLHEDFIIFVDEDGRSKILKNRLGIDENPLML